ncbi:hypothetical protein Ddye_003332 [Dipteronia dyeriana]|uniref:Uncharacterized protein n=1 Tax=Dipteronia dyeriana TaxID=168575 RepID=A0AAD9XSS8_9ROSI|nr:hypothetical protein Ddye_003332 [Dipteronia dyeriana]
MVLLWASRKWILSEKSQNLMVLILHLVFACNVFDDLIESRRRELKSRERLCVIKDCVWSAYDVFDDLGERSGKEGRRLEVEWMSSVIFQNRFYRCVMRWIFQNILT